MCGYIMMSLFIIASLVLIFSNSSDFKHFFVKQHQRNKKANQNYDKEELYKIIDNTVHSLSRSKTGALMTFERSTNLDDVMKSGTIIDAPVSQELLETIFYVGTRLHAGIHALNQKVRTIILAVDNRATEMGKDFNLPVIQRTQVEEKLQIMIQSTWRTKISIPKENIQKWKMQFKEKE